MFIRKFDDSQQYIRSRGIFFLLTTGLQSFAYSNWIRSANEPRSQLHPLVRKPFKVLSTHCFVMNHESWIINRPNWADSVIESPCPSVNLWLCAIGCSFCFRGLSLALRSHDQFQAFHWQNFGTSPVGMSWDGKHMIPTQSQLFAIPSPKLFTPKIIKIRCTQNASPSVRI